MKIVLLFISVIIFYQSFSQSHRFDWAKSYPYDGLECKSTKSLTTGDYFTIGSFKDSVDFDYAVGTYYLEARGYQDMFLMKHNFDNSLAWVKQIGSSQIVTNLDRVFSGELVIDSSENSIYISVVCHSKTE